MDHRLAEFAARLPSSLKIRGRSLRWAQRKLAGRYLPAEILDRPKQGFSSALPYILQGRVSRAVRALPAGLKAGRRRDPAPRAHRCACWQSTWPGRADHGNRLWLLINAELWYRMMILGQQREDLQLGSLRGKLASVA